MGTCADFKCKCGYEACGKWGIGMNPIYQEQKISLAPALCRDCRELVNIDENAVLLNCSECKGLNVVLYGDPGLKQMRRKSVLMSRPVHKEPHPIKHPGTGAEDHVEMPDDDDDELDFLDLNDDEFEVENYIDGVETTYYLCPKCNRFTLEKSGCGLFD